MRAWMISATLMLFPLLAAAQPPAPDPAAQLSRMEKLGFLVGTWEGEGWMVTGPAGRRSAHGTETVESRLGGLVLVIEGKFTSPESGEPVHQALGVLSWDPGAETYRFRAFLADGRAAESEGRFADGAFTWNPPAPPGMEIRYVLRLDDQGRWFEVGEMSRDGGETWNQFMEMTLKKAAG
jgi:Protein of unknown function (DUF1579)